MKGTKNSASNQNNCLRGSRSKTAKLQATERDLQQALQLTKVSLLIFLLGLCVVGRRESTWPIISWALYSGYSARFRPPEPITSVIELRVTTTDGNTLIVRPEHLLTVPRDSLAHSIVEQAFDDSNMAVRDESRQYLLQALTSFIRNKSKIQHVQAWKLSYNVEPLNVPPIQRQHPDTEVLIGYFSTDNVVKATERR